MFVPLHWRVLYVNVLSMAWGTFMSKMGAKTSADEVWTPIDEVFGAVRASTGVDLDRPEAAVAVVTGGWTYVIASSARRSSTALAGGLWGTFEERANVLRREHCPEAYSPPRGPPGLNSARGLRADVNEGPSQHVGTAGLESPAWTTSDGKNPSALGTR